MMSKGILEPVRGGALAIGLSSAAMAEMGPIEARQACMKANGAMMSVMVPIIKGEKPYDKAAIDERHRRDRSRLRRLGRLVGRGHEAGRRGRDLGQARNLDRQGRLRGRRRRLRARPREAVKASADEASFKAAFPALGKSCQSCHEKFRRPKD